MIVIGCKLDEIKSSQGCHHGFLRNVLQSGVSRDLIVGEVQVAGGNHELRCLHCLSYTIEHGFILVTSKNALGFILMNYSDKLSDVDKINNIIS